MLAVRSLSETVTLLKRNPGLVPVLFLGNLPLVYLNQLELFLPNGGDSLGTVVSIFVAPFVLGGLYAVLDEVTDGGDARMGTFVDGALGNYASILGATLLYVLAAIVSVFVLVIMAAIPLLNVLVLVGTIPLAIFAAMVVQFVNVAIVVGDERAVGSFVRSYDLVTRRPASAFGYSVVRLAVALAFAAVPLWLVFQQARSLAGVDAVSLGTVGVVAVTFSGLSALVLLPMHVVYFKDVEGVEPTPSSGRTADPGDRLEDV